MATELTKAGKNKPPKQERGKLIRLAALNIAMHAPHSPGRYVEMFEDAFALRRHVPLGQLHSIMLGRLDRPTSDDPHAPLTGEIYRFVQLDPSDPWFNTRTNQQAEDDEVEEINIPSHLLPHLQRIPFVFFPDVHRLVFVTKMGQVALYSRRQTVLGPATAAKFFAALFAQKEIVSKFSQVNVTVIPQSDSLARIFAMPIIERLTIVVTRPNPGDDGADESVRIQERMRVQNASKVTIGMDAADQEEGLKPDAGTKAIAVEAAENGKVVAQGRDRSGAAVTLSTENMPRIEQTKLYERTQTMYDMLKQGLSLFNRRR